MGKPAKSISENRTNRYAILSIGIISIDESHLICIENKEFQL
jgi:hypothetical protein